MKKTLFFLTDNYPYGHGEPFIENEINILADNFKKVIIISKNILDKQTRSVPKNCEVYRISKDYKKIVSVLLDKYYIHDLLRNIDIKNMKKIFSFQFYSKLIELKITELIKLYKIEKSDIILYSYWFYNGAYAGSVLKRKDIVYKVISRAHRYDLYLEENYQPLKNIILSNLSHLIACSKEGTEYLKNKYPEYATKIKYSYLGTNNTDEFKPKQKNKVILSCSYIVKVKRVELIVDALSKLHDNDITWYHIGSGVLEKDVNEAARVKLKNIKYKFLGQLSNKQVLKFYKDNNILCLVNVSSSEGLPVSMMEAQSFGIPIIATNVGGVSEIVNEKTGYLLAANPDSDDILQSIENIISLSTNDYRQLQINSYKNWNCNFNAEKNYNKFVELYLK